MRTILVVDDEEAVRDVIKDTLTAEKFSVITASGGEEAIAKARKHKPDLILLDIGMPGLDGYMTCEKLKNDPQANQIPVLFLSGKLAESEEVIEHCKKLSAAGFFCKLNPMPDLLEDIKEVLFRS